VRLITRSAHPQGLTERGPRMHSITADFQARQRQPGDRPASIVTTLLPPGMPWHDIEAALQAAARTAAGSLRSRARAHAGPAR
jgi:hypothetical protein